MARRRSSEEKVLTELLKLVFYGLALIANLVVLALTIPLHLLGLWGRRSEQKQLAALLESQNRTKRDLLEARYQDVAIVDAIMAGSIWHDMTKEQLLQSWGDPEEIETKTLKTKIKEIYKYDRTGVGRFGRRATLENDRVVGWETKS